MQGNLLPIIIAAVLAIVLAIVIGASAGAGSVWAILIPGAIVGLVIAGLMKDKVWWLLFFIPAVAPLVPLPTTVSQSTTLAAFMVILPFVFIRTMRGQWHWTWYRMPWLDIPILIFALYIFGVLVSNPFGLQLDWSKDYYGSWGYLYMAQGLVLYLFFSILDKSSDEVLIANKWTVYISIAVSLVSPFVGKLLSRGGASPDVPEASLESDTNYRVTAFSGIGTLCWHLLWSRMNFAMMVRRIWPALLVGLSFAGVAISGFRSALFGLLTIYLGTALIKRRVAELCVYPLLALASLYTFSGLGVLRDLPNGAQRALSALPGLDLKENVVMDAKGSSEWRFTMWQWALDDKDPRKFIRDKTWGDGFVQRTQDIRNNFLEEYGVGRGASNFAANTGERFAYQRMWHSGPVSTVNAIGYVGLALTTILGLLISCFAYRVGRIYVTRARENDWVTVYLMAPMIFAVPGFWFVFGECQNDVPRWLMSAALIKFLFCRAKREGWYVPHSHKIAYVPMSVRRLQSDEPDGDVSVGLSTAR